MGFRFFLTNQSAGEFLSLEGLKIVDLFADPDEVDRKGRAAAFLRESKKHAALRGAVKFCHDKTGQTDRLIKLTDLSEGILTVCAVNHENDFVRGARQGFFLRALDAGELFHEVRLRRQTACGIGEHDINAAGLGRAHGVKNDCRGISALLRHYMHLISLAPLLKLLTRSSTEGVAGEQYGFVPGRKPLGNLSDGGGFTGTVDACHHDDKRMSAFDIEILLGRLQHPGDDIDQFAADFLLGLQPLQFDRLAEFLDNFFRSGETGIGRDQRVLQVFEKVLVDYAA